MATNYNLCLVCQKAPKGADGNQCDACAARVDYKSPNGKTITAAHVDRLQKNLIEFGYEGLTRETVAEAVAKLVAGENPVGIIGMMARSQLQQNGLL